MDTMGSSSAGNCHALGLAQMTDLEREELMSHQDVESIHDNVIVHAHQSKKKPRSSKNGKSKGTSKSSKSKAKSSKGKPKSSKSKAESSKSKLEASNVTDAKAKLLPIEEQQHAAWNLNRLSHPSLPIGPAYNYTSDGTGVNVYIVDTVRWSHIVVGSLGLHIVCRLNPIDDYHDECF